jgi:hypothetical protein
MADIRIESAKVTAAALPSAKSRGRCAMNLSRPHNVPASSPTSAGAGRARPSPGTDPHMVPHRVIWPRVDDGGVQEREPDDAAREEPNCTEKLWARLSHPALAFSEAMARLAVSSAEACQEKTSRFNGKNGAPEEIRTPNLLIRSQKARNGEIIDLSDFLGVQRRTVQAVFCAQNGPLSHVILGWRGRVQIP